MLCLVSFFISRGEIGSKGDEEGALSNEKRENGDASTPKDGCRMNIEMRVEEEHAGLITAGSSEPARR